MLFLIGFGTKIKRDIWEGQFSCPNCNRMSNFYLHRVLERGYLFYIPIASKTIKRLSVCDACQHGRELSKEEYKNIKKAQQIKMRNGAFPYDVIMQEYNPAKIKYGRKVLALVLASIFSFMMLVSALNMALSVPSWDASVPVGIVFMLSIGIVPLVFAIRSVASASRKKKLFFSVYRKS